MATTPPSIDPTRRRRLLAALPSLDEAPKRLDEGGELERYLQADRIVQADSLLEPLQNIAPEKLR